VYAEWLESDRSNDPANLEAFIIERANSMDRSKRPKAWLRIIVEGRLPEYDRLTDQQRFDLIEELKRQQDAAVHARRCLWLALLKRSKPALFFRSLPNGAFPAGQVFFS
jgi:hypothetical protein